MFTVQISRFPPLRPTFHEDRRHARGHRNKLEMSPAKVTESRRLLLVFTPTLYDWAEPIKP